LGHCSAETEKLFFVLIGCEPGGAFFPIDEIGASRITIEELPLTGTFEMDCSYGMGLGDLIFEHAQKHTPHS
jgi:hypothetical protein